MYEYQKSKINKIIPNTYIKKEKKYYTKYEYQKIKINMNIKK